MTEKQFYENVLREVRKAKAPSLHLEDLNYWGSKGIQEYSNERYLQFATTQQLSDDLQALTSSVNFTITPPQLLGAPYVGAYTGGFVDSAVAITIGKKYGSDFYRFKAPDNYWHMLGSHVSAGTRRPYKCFPTGYTTNKVSKRLSANTANGIINNSFLNPNFERPYHSFGDGTGGNIKPDLFYYVGDLSKFFISDIYMDYLKEPRPMNLTIQQRDLPIDTSLLMEFPEYVCAEIVKRTVKLVLEASSDPRLQTKIPVDTSIP